METRANYVLIGAFTLLATVSLLLFALWAAKFSSDRNWREFEVHFTEPVTGLTEGGGVQYNGIAVGTVDRLRLDRDDPRKVIALLKLKADAPVKVDTKAKLSQQASPRAVHLSTAAAPRDVTERRRRNPSSPPRPSLQT